MTPDVPGGRPLTTEQKDGWPRLKLVVAARDGGCLATHRGVFGDDVAPDMCRDARGYLMTSTDYFRLEFDHVKEQQAMALRAPNDEAHGIAVCPWHHRLSREWRSDTAAHRAVIRDYLRRLYPREWAV